MAKSPRVPKLTRHKHRSLGVVRLSGQDHYPGPWPDPDGPPPAETEAEYGRLIARWLAGGRRPLRGPSVRDLPPADGLTVLDLGLAYLAHARTYYRRKDGSATSEAQNVTYPVRALFHAHAALAACDFRPAHLKAARDLIVSGYDHPEYGPQKSCARKVTNQRVAILVRAFKWAAGEELISEDVWLRLTAFFFSCS